MSMHGDGLNPEGPRDSVFISRCDECNDECIWTVINEKTKVTQCQHGV